MIELDDSEHYSSPLQEDTLRILLSFLPREDYDKLLYRGNAYVRLGVPCSRNVRAIRPDTDNTDYVIDLFNSYDNQDQNDQAAPEKVSAMAHSG